MIEEQNKLFSLDRVYLIFIMLLGLCFLNAKSGLNLLFLTVTAFYYIRIKIYRWKKYH